MREIIRYLEKRSRIMLIRYIFFKVILAFFTFLYYWYVAHFVKAEAWDLGFKTLILLRDLLIIVLVVLVYAFVMVSLYIVGVYSVDIIFNTAILFVASILKADPERLHSILVGGIILAPADLLVGGLVMLLIFSLILDISFTVRGSISHFMWSVAIALLALIGLEAAGATTIRIYEWPPHNLGEIVFNSVVILAAFTFFIIEVCGNLAYASSVIDGYRLKYNRMKQMVTTLLMGKTRSAEGGRETSVEGGGIRLSPLAEILLRGYTGVYALEETTEELTGKIVGFVSTEGKRDKRLIEALTGVSAAPHFERMILSIILGLFFKLPLCVILVIFTLVLAQMIGSNFKGVVEAGSPSFIVLTFVLVAVIFYYLGVIISRKHR